MTTVRAKCSWCRNWAQLDALLVRARRDKIINTVLCPECQAEQDKEHATNTALFPIIQEHIRQESEDAERRAWTR